MKKIPEGEIYFDRDAQVMKIMKDGKWEEIPEVIKPVFEVRRNKMANPKYSLRVYPYLLGQLRIQLCNDEEDIPDDKDHGQVVREMCTYKHATMLRRVTELAMNDEPEALARSWCTSKNCEDFENGRIRLDQ